MTPSRTRFAVLVFIVAAAFITYLDRVCISVAAPAMQAELGLSQTQFGWVFTVFYIAYSIAELPASWLGDRWGQRVTLVRIVGCWSLFTMFTGLSRGFGSLLFTRFVFGGAEAGAFPTMSRALSRWFPLQARGRANGLMWSGARAGGAIAPPIAVLIIAALGWRAAFGVFGLVGLVWCAVCWWWYRDDPADHPSVNAAELELIRVGGSPAPERSQKVPWKLYLRNPTMLALFFSYFASGFGFQFFVTWLPIYFVREHGLNLKQSGFYAALPLAAGATGCYLGGLFADLITRRTGNVTIGRRTVGVSGFLLGAIGYTSAIYMQSPMAAIACLALAQGAHDMTLPVLWATTTDAGGRFGGTAAGFVNFASTLSGMLGPLTADLLQRTFGSFHAVFFLAAGLYVCGGLLWFIIDPKKVPESSYAS